MPTMNRRPHAHLGMTLRELVIVVFATLIIFAALGLIFTAHAYRNPPHFPIRDGANLRGIHQGLVIFAQDNGERFPVPSLLDANDATESAATMSGSLGSGA